jgi:hypothetical protein
MTPSHVRYQTAPPPDMCAARRRQEKILAIISKIGNKSLGISGEGYDSTKAFRHRARAITQRFVVANKRHIRWKRTSIYDIP